MRITFVIPTLDLSGGNRVIAAHAAQLRMRGHEVEVVVAKRRARSGWAFTRSLFKGELRLQTGIPGARSHVEEAGFEPRVSASERVSASDVQDADVIVATWWETAEWVSVMPASKGAKVYLVQHHEVFPYTPRVRVEATYRTPLLQRVAVARWLVEKLQSEYGDSRVQLVPNAVDHTVFNGPLRDKQTKPTVGFMFSHATFKGVEVALRALCRLKSASPNVVIRAFGTEDLQIDDALSLPIVYAKRPLEREIADAYRSIDVWLASSHSEGFNLPALEAMACRTPVVSTRTGWPEDAIVEGVNGYLADVGDDATLARRLGDVLSLDNERWQGMSNSAYSTAAALNWSTSGAMFEAVLKEACAQTIGRTAVAI